jgi:hypothetical protein
MWHAIPGRVRYFTGTSGTVTFASGARILQIHALAGSGAGSVQIPTVDETGLGSVTIPLPGSSGWWGIQENHVNHEVPVGASIVFTGTASYLVEYLRPAGQG